MSRILVTGGAGFIGSHLCDKLIADGHFVINIDNFNDFYSPKIKHDNVIGTQELAKSLRKESNYKLAEGDIRDRVFLESVFLEYKPEIVVHLAAMAGVRPSIENANIYTEVNILGMVNILECLKAFNVLRYVFASSSSVYGNNEKVPFSESDSVDNPISPYAATKKAGELLNYSYHYLYGINTACLRFFTVYGPRQRPDLAIHKFTELISQGKPISVFGDGSTERDYTYIDDIIDGIVKAIAWTDANKRVFEIFNLGESRTIRLDKMIASIEDALEKKAIINRLSEQQGDVQRTWADVSKAKKMLGYAPKMDFDQGIRKFVHWYKTKYTTNGVK